MALPYARSEAKAWAKETYNGLEAPISPPSPRISRTWMKTVSATT